MSGAPGNVSPSNHALSLMSLVMRKKLDLASWRVSVAWRYGQRRVQSYDVRCCACGFIRLLSSHAGPAHVGLVVTIIRVSFLVAIQ
jgi:hypothetical protein